jgi:FemAB-related protein (PEP-CTERM system-associated)
MLGSLFGFGVYIRRLLDIAALVFLTRFTRKPLRFFGLAGGGIFGVGMLTCLVLVIQFLLGGDNIDTRLKNRAWLIFGVLMIVLGVQTFFIGLVAEIVIFTQGRNLRDYKVEKVSEGSGPMTGSVGDGGQRRRARPRAGAAARRGRRAARTAGARAQARRAARDRARRLMAEPAPPQVVVAELAPAFVPHGFDEYVERHPGATFFHDSAWRDLVVRHFPAHRPRYLEARRGERRVGVLPLFETRSPLSGPALVSLPYAVYGGPLASDEAAARALRERLEAMVHGGKLRFAELRCRDVQPGFAELPRSPTYATFVRELPADPEECLAMIPRKSRASTRQARDKHGLAFVEAPERLDEFHRLFVLNKQRLGSPAFARDWFGDLLRLGRRRTRLHLVLRGKEVLVAVLSFLHREAAGDVWNPYYSGSAPHADRLAASNFAYWQLMRVAADEGFRRFDFGRSRVGTGPYDFKRNMGFEPAPLPYCFVLNAGAAIPAVNPGNERFSLAQDVIRALPYGAARALGPPLLRFVPERSARYDPRRLGRFSPRRPDGRSAIVAPTRKPVNRPPEAAEKKSSVLPLEVLLVDDEESIRVTLADELAAAGHRVTALGNGADALRLIGARVFDVVVSDIRMPGAEGTAVLERVKQLRPETEVILMTGYGTIESAVQALRAGAYHYVVKPFLNEDIVAHVERIAAMKALADDNARLRERAEREGFGTVIGRSRTMQEVLRNVKTVAKSDASVLIEGESGTGKEVIARAIHDNSGRAKGPFVPLSCASLPETLIEAELFGHEAGSFTDAKKLRRGRFELAQAGTLFLDDIDDLKLEVQVKLLRAIETRKIERVGSEKQQDIDIRLLCATKKDLQKMAEAGEFREDLYFRINVVTIKLPPLRERSEDVPLLVEHFMRAHGGGRPYEVKPEVMEELIKYPWPGNVRELRHAVERAIAMAGEGRHLKREH